MTADEIAKLEAMQERVVRAEAARKELIHKYDTDYSPEADAEIGRANNEKMVAEALLSAAAVHNLTALLEIAKKAL